MKFFFFRYTSISKTMTVSFTKTSTTWMLKLQHIARMFTQHMTDPLRDPNSNFYWNTPTILQTNQ